MFALDSLKPRLKIENMKIMSLRITDKRTSKYYDTYVYIAYYFSIERENSFHEVLFSWKKAKETNTG